MEKKITPPWMKGLIISLVLIICNLALYFAGQAQNRALGLIGLVLLAGGLIFACTSYANDMQGNVTFGNVFAHGFKVTATTAVIMIVYSVIAMKLLFPEMVNQILDQARVDMEKKGTLSEDQISQGLEMTRKFFLPFMIGGIIVMYAIIGAIGSLIGAAVAKKNPDYTPIQ
jgi:hypothetical protein